MQKKDKIRKPSLMNLEISSEDIATLKSIKSGILELAKLVGFQANSKKLTRKGINW